MSSTAQLGYGKIALTQLFLFIFSKMNEAWSLVSRLLYSNFSWLAELLSSSEVSRSQNSIRGDSRERDALIGDDAGVSGYFVGVQASELSILLSPRDEERRGLCNLVETTIVEICSIHDIDLSGFEDELVKYVHTVCISV